MVKEVDSFNELKAALTKHTTLTLLSPDRQLFVDFDTSGAGIGVPRDDHHSTVAMARQLDIVNTTSRHAVNKKLIRAMEFVSQFNVRSACSLVKLRDAGLGDLGAENVHVDPSLALGLPLWMIPARDFD
ncbi:hypothetical protein E4U56_007799 [Claviceps arundinis]|uniref:Uncharacterized protein n=1 Tax=Claviceps arundinis TaxID=1623583 RepID=A0A9P7N172_9HYPO|nr:hypothetical protein E4U56_007799 [Claviceps arundinis]